MTASQDQLDQPPSGIRALTFDSVAAAQETLRPVVHRTRLERIDRLSREFGAEVYLRREDLQSVRSYKIRGAYYKMSRLGDEARARGVVCASAGNHAQGVAESCGLLRIPGVIFMPRNTPRQKIQRVRSLGGDWTRLQIVGDTFDAAKQAAEAHGCETGMTFIHPFDDPDVISGQGTVALELTEQLSTPPDLLIVPVGGGGLLAGTLLVTRERWPGTEVVGVEPEGAASMRESIRAGRVVRLERVNPFVDGAAVREAGALPFALRAANPGRDLVVNEGLVCSTLIALYQNEGIVAEPAGALTVSALRLLREEIEGKTVVCVVSGGNNDISRYPEIIERSLLFEGLKHYFLVDFPQRAGALRRYLDEALGPNDDITLFEYVKKNNREFGPALVGVELSDPADLAPLLTRMEAIELKYERVEADSVLYRFLL